MPGSMRMKARFRRWTASSATFAVWDSAGCLRGQTYNLSIAGPAHGGRALGRGHAHQSIWARAERAGGELISAHSPQAKGRVERLFKTFQDRVIKEMRLADVSTLDAANQFLRGCLPIYNRRFAVQPAGRGAASPPSDTPGIEPHPVPEDDPILRRDWTGAHHEQLYQVRSNVRATHDIVEDQVDGTMQMSHSGRPLTYQAIVARPLRVPPPPTIARPQRKVTPTRAHPWRKRLLLTRDTHATAALHKPDISTVA